MLHRSCKLQLRHYRRIAYTFVTFQTRGATCDQLSPLYRYRFVREKCKRAVQGERYVNCTPGVPHQVDTQPCDLVVSFDWVTDANPSYLCMETRLVSVLRPIGSTGDRAAAASKAELHHALLEGGHKRPLGATFGDTLCVA